MSRIEAVLLASPDPVRLAEYYQAAFGLDPPKAYGPDHLGFKLENVYLGIERTDEPSPGTNSIWFQCGDIEAAVRRLVDLGGALESAPAWHETAKEYLAVVRDPDGNRMGLIARER
ncbi:MAG: VOC family protein [Planctomycetota bacterium]|jgi:predicted enzyme related to lactoylglutathione lyase